MPTLLRIRFPLACILAVIAATSIVACGGSSGQVVAKVDGVPITKAEVNHWMSTLAGGDFYELSRKHVIPAGLVSDPANFPGCVATLEAAIKRGGSAATKQSPAQLLMKCKQLNRRIKQQAIAYLIEAQWVIGLAREKGMTASDAEVNQLFDQIKKQEFASERKFTQFLADNRRSIADERFVTMLDVLRRKLSGNALNGGKAALAKFAEEGQRWAAKTTCQAGYVVQHCKEYTGEPTAETHQPSAAVLLEQVASVTGAEPCVNRAACD